MRGQVAVCGQLGLGGCAVDWASGSEFSFAERTLLKTRDFRQHVLWLGFHFKVRQIAVLMVRDAHFVLNGIEHLQHPRQLMFGQ